jgi:hypothetical protein
MNSQTQQTALRIQMTFMWFRNYFSHVL